jgi:hypothetical protein
MTGNAANAPLNTAESRELFTFMCLAQRIFLGYEQQMVRQQPSSNGSSDSLSDCASSDRRLNVYKAVARQAFLHHQQFRKRRRSSEMRGNSQLPTSDANRRTSGGYGSIRSQQFSRTSG